MNVPICNLVQVIDLIERDLPGWTWLIRSTKKKGVYFANIMSPDFQGIVQLNRGVAEDLSQGRCYKHTSPSPSLALAQAYASAIEGQK